MNILETRSTRIIQNIAKYARWVVQEDGPAIFETPIPIDCCQQEVAQLHCKFLVQLIIVL